MKNRMRNFFLGLGLAAMLTVTTTTPMMAQSYNPVPILNGCDPNNQSCVVSNCVMATMQGPSEIWAYMPEFLLVFPYDFLMAMLDLLGF
jgi:hypothetical protein